MINRVIIMGRLCSDPEIKQTTSGISFCRFRVAVDRPYSKDAEQTADFINITAWRQTAEFVARYFGKGKMIAVEGSMRNNDYTDNNGVKHYGMDVLADRVSFCGDRGSGENAEAQIPAQNTAQRFDTLESPPRSRPAQAAPAAPRNSAPQPQYTQPQLGEFEQILSDGDVPF